MMDEMLHKISEEEQMKELQRAREIFLWNQRCLEIEAEKRGLEEGRAEGRREGGIEALILDNLEDRNPEEEILAKLEKRFSLSREEAKRYFETYRSNRTASRKVSPSRIAVCPTYALLNEQL